MVLDFELRLGPKEPLDYCIVPIAACFHQCGLSRFTLGILVGAVPEELIDAHRVAVTTR